MTPNPNIVLSMINTPSKFFENPSQVASCPGLRRSDRIDILRSWKHDVILLMKADEENMTSNFSYNLEDIDAALRKEDSDGD